MSRALAVALVLASGCAWDDGSYFTVVDGHLRAGLTPATGYEIDRFELYADEIVLAAAAGDDAPPDDGHAHRVIAALAPDQVEVLGLEVGVIDLVAGVDRPLACEGSCGIGTTTTLERAHLELSRVVLVGRIPDGVGGTVAVDLDTDAAGTALDGSLELVVDRHADATEELAFELYVPATTLSGVTSAADLLGALADLELGVHSGDHEHD